MKSADLVGDRIPKPEALVCVFDSDNKPLPHIFKADAEFLWRVGWGEWIGSGSRQHLRLTPSAPLRLLTGDSRKTTARVHAQGGARTSYAAGQLLPGLTRHKLPKS
jgi:hypothetical protein